jgi:small-conductance mechanosensitive channel
MNEEYKKKINSLSIEELALYYSAVRNTSAVVSILGVSTLFVMITFTNFLTIVFGSILVFMFSNFSVGIENTKNYIKDRINLKINS